MYIACKIWLIVKTWRKIARLAYFDPKQVYFKAKIDSFFFNFMLINFLVQTVQL